MVGHGAGVRAGARPAGSSKPLSRASSAVRPTKCMPDAGSCRGTGISRTSRVAGPGVPSRCRRYARGRPRERGQPRVGAQNALMQVAEIRPRLDSQLADQGAASVLVGGQGLGWAPVTIEGEHQHPVRVLPERVGGGELPQLGDHLTVPAEIQISVDPGFERLGVHLGDPRFVLEEEQFRGYVGQRPACAAGTAPPAGWLPHRPTAHTLRPRARASAGSRTASHQARRHRHRSGSRPARWRSGRDRHRPAPGAAALHNFAASSVPRPAARPPTLPQRDRPLVRPGPHSGAARREQPAAWQPRWLPESRPRRTTSGPSRQNSMRRPRAAQAGAAGGAAMPAGARPAGVCGAYGTASVCRCACGPNHELCRSLAAVFPVPSGDATAPPIARNGLISPIQDHI